MTAAASVRESDIIAGVYVVEPQQFGDERGVFVETYRREWIPGGREMIQAQPGRPVAGLRRRAALPPAPGRLLVRAVGAGPGRAARPARRHADRRRDRSRLRPRRARRRRDRPPGVLIPPGVAHGFAVAHRHDDHVPRRRLLQPGRRARRRVGRPARSPPTGASTTPILSDRDREQPEARRDHRPRPSRSGRCAHEAARHRRRRLHRLELRALVAPDAHPATTIVVAYDALTYAGQPREPRRRRRPHRVRARRHRRPRARRASCSATTSIDVDRQLRGRVAQLPTRSSNPAVFFRTNVVGTQTLCEAARRVGVDAASTTSRRARSTATSRSTRPSRSPSRRRTGPARRTTRRRPAATTRYAPTTRPSACRSRSRTARTTTGRTSSRRRSSRSSPTQRARRPAAPAVRVDAEPARVDPRRRPLPRDRRRARRRPRRRDVPRRHRRGAQHRGDRRRRARARSASPRR